MIISLIGLTGTGKTTIGRLLAARLHLDFTDLDESIVLQEGKSIPDIFAAAGEEGFRDIESELLQQQCASTSRIISTGGGAVLRDENRKCLLQAGPVIWLDAPQEVIAQRVSGDTNRPLIYNSDPSQKVNEMDRLRREFYRDCASCIVDTSRAGVEETVDAIMAYLSESGHV
ncbi:MAG TPA: shikimate kinase [Mariprofundaceae bacterium]|nr:shikimate kinase [Mariprofundaceae bacterium]